MLTSFYRLLAMAPLALVLAATAGCTERRAENFRRQGDALYALARYDEALPYYERATELAPNNARAHSGLGRCYAAKQKYDLAAEQFRAAVALDASAHADHAKNLAILQECGQHDAAKDLARMLQADPDSKGMAAPPPQQAAPAPAGWQALWKKAALHELLERRAEFPPEDGLEESLLLSALFTANQPLVTEIGSALPFDSPMRPYYEAIARKDGRAAIGAAEDWTELSDLRKPLREYAYGYALAVAGARAHAIQVYSNALKLWPDNNVGLYAIGQVFANSQMPKLAARCLQNLVARGGENIPVRVLLFQILNEADLPDEARRNAEALYSIAPGLPASATTLAQVYLDQNQGELALAVLRRGLEANPGDHTLVISLAGALLRQDSPDEARAQLEQLSQENAGQLTALRIGAFASARLASWPETEAYCMRATSAGPGEPIRLLHAAAVAHQGRYGEARRLLAELAATAEPPGCAPVVSPASAAAAVEKESDNAIQNLAAGWAYYHARLFKGALETLEPSLNSTEPARLLGALFACILHGLPPEERVARATQLANAHANDPEAWLGLSRVLAALDDDDAQRAALDTAARLAPESVDVLRARVQFYEHTGDAEQAIEAYRRLAQLAPDDPAVNNNLAYALLTSGGNPADALPIAERAARLSAPNASIFHTLGLAQFMLGRFEESRKSLWQAIELRPLDPTLLFDYGQALLATNQRDEGHRQIALAVTLSDQLGLDFPRRAEAAKILEGS